MATKARRYQAPWESHPGEDDRTTVLGHLRYEIERMAGEAASVQWEPQRRPLLLHVQRLGEEVDRIAEVQHPEWWWKERRDWAGPRLIGELLRTRVLRGK